MNEQNSIALLLQTASPQQLIQSNEVGERFKKLYQLTHPNISPEQSGAFYEAEKFHFLKIVSENAKVGACTKMSLYGIFLDMAVNGLSFDPSFKHAYVVPFKHNAGTQQNPQWESRASLQISGYGELLLRQKQGQLKYADNPVLVYEGDEFQHGMRDGKSFLNHIANVPAKSDKIIACYVRLVRTDGTSDVKVLTQADMDRFRKFSKDPESKAWVAGEGGMWIAKCIKHAFKNYPKVRTGSFSELASNTVDEEAEDITNQEQRIPERIDYGTGEVLTATVVNTQHVDDNSFATNTQQNQQPSVTHHSDEF